MQITVLLPEMRIGTSTGCMLQASSTDNEEPFNDESMIEENSCDGYQAENISFECDECGKCF